MLNKNSLLVFLTVIPCKLSSKRIKEVVLKGRFYLVHDACTNRTWALYEWYTAIVRNETNYLTQPPELFSHKRKLTIIISNNA